MKRVNQSKLGRPVKVPKPRTVSNQNNGWAEQIFKDCGAPSTWGINEIEAISQILVEIPFYKSRLTKGEMFIKMWLDAPEVMLKAMPRFYLRRKKIFETSETFIVEYVKNLYRNSKGKSGELADESRKILEEFWTAKADEVNNLFSNQSPVEMKFTEKHVSNAREKLRDTFPPPKKQK